ncbi:MAG TPA: ribokinase [Streptosporangiaceae bacterium]|nr:ribokinase [Streptosporangiaceae bacterium]
MTRPRVAVVGSLNLDLTLRVARLPGPGETVLSTSPAAVTFGGKGGNQAAAAAAFGGEVVMIGSVGGDDAARDIREDLERRGINISHIRSVGEARSGSATIAVDEGGDNLILVDPGANNLLEPGDLPADVLAEADVILVQLEIPLPAVAAAVRAARGTVVLNPAPATQLQPEVLSRADVLVPNRTELAMLAGGDQPGSLPAVARLARRVAGEADVVVTLGADGALVVPNRGSPVTHIAAPHVAVVDATGAGDCFCGTLAVSLADGIGITAAARLSVAAAGISTTAPGARGRLPARREVESLAACLAVRNVEGA